MRLPKTSRERQSGTTLVELLVSVVIIGFAITLVIGAFSSGLLQATLAKRDTASTAVVEYEMNEVSAMTFSASAQNYSECFATETRASAPVMTSAFQGSCPDSTYTLRADVSVAPGPNGAQQWTIAVVTWPGQAQYGSPISIVKVNR